jgi:retron-type reverse transcriptase
MTTIQDWFNYIEKEIKGLKTQAAFKEYVSVLFKNNVPIIFENKHLAANLGVKPAILAKIIAAPESFYYNFQIPKRKGGVRKISAPYPLLLEIQRWINNYILSKTDLGNYSFAYRQNKSIVDHAKIHLGEDDLLKVDLKNFFPTIKLERIIAVFQHYGYTNKIAYSLARLCSNNSCLPQGAATSPTLSNIIAKRLDLRLGKLSEKYLLKYSRYADDLAFSGKSISVKYVGILEKIINSEGFEIRKDKTQLIRGPFKRKILTGISISGGKLSLPKDTKRELRKEIYYLTKNGIIEHSKHLNKFDPIYTERLLGRLHFWKMIEGESSFINHSINELYKYQKTLNKMVS